MEKTVFIKLRKAVAILVAVALLATLAAVVPVAAETATSYNGTMFNYVKHTSTSGLITDSQRGSTEYVNNITANVHYVKGETEITSENYGTDVNYYSYSAQSNTLADLSSSDAVSWTENTAIMFYVKLPFTMAETKLYLEIQSKTDEAEKATYSGLSKNATAYLLDNASIQWESTATAALGVSKKSGAGSITLPAGFEGWVRVPAESFSNAPTVEQKIFRIDFYFNNYNTAEYTAYGALMVVDNATENLTSLTLGENTINLIETAAYKATALSLGEFSSNDYYSLNADGTSNAQTAGVFDKGTSYNLSITSGNVEEIGYKDDFYTADYANYVCQGGAAVLRTNGIKDTSWATFAFNNTLPVTFNGSRGFDFAAITEFVGNEQSKSFNIGLKSDSNSNSGTDEDIAWNADRSMMFYIETTATKANKFSFIVEGAPSEGTTKIYSRLAVDKKYYLLSNGANNWQEVTTAVAYEGSWGYIEIPAGFKGFVRIPCNAILRNATTQETGTINKVSVYPYNFGGDYGELTIGAFGTVDKTTENLMYISSTATDNKPIFMASGTAYSVTKANPTGNKSTAKTTGYTWDGKTVSAENLNTETLATGTQVWMEISSAPITSEGAILFYTESTSDAIATGGVNAQTWSCTFKDNPYYLLADGASDWTENTVQSGGVNNNGYIEIPANYKGWVMIPVSSFNTNLSKNNTEITQFGFWPKTLNGSISFSNIMTTDIADVALYVNDGEKIASLFDINNTFDCEVVSFNVSVKEGNITTDASVNALNATAVTTEESALDEDKGLMFFAKTSNAVKFGLELSDGNTLNDEFTYYTIEHNGLWTENSAIDGNISLEAGFEGWVRVSANAFESYAIDYVAIGFAEACDCIISDFMVIDQSAYDLDYIVIDGKKYSLFVELYDANADGEIDIRDLVRMKRYTAMVEGVKVPKLAADIDRADGVNANDVTSVRKRLINGPENIETEVTLSRYLADEGYTTAATYENSTATVDNVNFSVLPAEYTSLLSNNPDRGWTSKEVYSIPSAGSEKLQDSYETILSDIKKKLSVNTYDQTVTLSRIFLKMTEYKTSEVISDEAIAYMENILKAYRELGVKVYLNIYYQAGHDDTIVTSDIVLKHIDQYAPIWNEYSDVIYCYCVSLIGAWGEWTSTGNGVGNIPAMTSEEKQAIADKVMANLPDDMYIAVRNPMIKTKYFSAYSEKYNIGYDQSAFFGYDYTDEDIGQGAYRPGQDAYNQAIAEAPYGIMFAETFTSNWYNNNTAYKKIEALGAIKGLSELRINAFNINHAYGDIATYGGKISDTVLYGWKLDKVTQGDLSDLGVLVTDSWFKDARGKTITRSAFDYIRDYLGYRISADSLSVTGGNNAGEAINISMNLKNYGFSAAFNLESGFAILDENNNIVSEVISGNPTNWHSTSPENYNDRAQLTHNITANMNLPTEAGNYKIAFFLRNDLGQTARLDNLIEYADGFNILHMFSID